MTDTERLTQIATLLLNLESYMPTEIDHEYQEVCLWLTGHVDGESPIYPELWRAAHDCHHCGRWKRHRR